MVALALTAFPLPPWLDVARPAFLVLTVLYWSINAPRSGGVAFGFFAGLMLDIFQGPILGEHALALSLIAYVAVREHQRIRSKPGLQQALIVFAFLVVYEFVLFCDRWLDRAPGHKPHALDTRPDRRADLATGRRAARLRRGQALVSAPCQCAGR